MSPQERRLIEGIVAAGDALSFHSDLDEAFRLLYETLRDAGYGSGGQPFESARRALVANRQGFLHRSRMTVCPDCGNKRCPHATDPALACTGSNEPGQPGSRYPAPSARPTLSEEGVREILDEMERPPTDTAERRATFARANEMRDHIRRTLAGPDA